MARFTLRRAALPDMTAIARLNRHVRKTCLPYLPDLHTPDEDLAFFQEQVFPTSEVWIAEAGVQLIGFAGARLDWLDHLYVDPDWHGQGVGSALLSAVSDNRAELNLWTFQENAQARRFYERQGFGLIALTDGSGNEERCPDAHYRWIRHQSRPDQR
ncbi:GNAT family N-acetyltransferase [Microvirga sp. CF3016]|uniref:GNAT family N-acetyltransferase n=1 Tax=Microvirga sp. CF3016 TaxID=3110181 RepID=UPI002E7830B7|nr:GNAT family N-acetyltransferase [Microvirga sp. CF3016]MEE1610498.1 GNAT family N-acetyltransferase [Microvirga sp. CF3016]